LATGWHPSSSITGLKRRDSDLDDLEELEIIYEGIVKIIYEANPIILDICHLNNCGGNSAGSCGYTPLHFLCLEGIPLKNLLGYFALKSPSSFAVIASRAHIRRYAKLFTGQSWSTDSTGSCLHLIVKHNLCDENIVQTIIKAAPTMVMAKGNGYQTPLSVLCGRYGVFNSYSGNDDHVFISMFYSLLQANFSDEVIESPPVAMLLKNRTFVFHLLKRCFKSTDSNSVHYDGTSKAEEIFDMLCEINLWQFDTVLDQEELFTWSKRRLIPEQNLLQVAASLLKGMINHIQNKK
jgi:hypothetical protein